MIPDVWTDVSNCEYADRNMSAYFLQIYGHLCDLHLDIDNALIYNYLATL